MTVLGALAFYFVLSVVSGSGIPMAEIEGRTDTLAHCQELRRGIVSGLGGDGPREGGVTITITECARGEK